MPIADIIHTKPSVDSNIGCGIRAPSIGRSNFFHVFIMVIALVFAKGCGGGGDDSNAVAADPASQANAESANQRAAESLSVEQDDKLASQARDYLNKGFERLRNRDILKANYYFIKSDQAASTNASKFFRAFTDVAAIFFDTQRDNTADGLRDIGDFLDAFGAESSGRNPWRGIAIQFPDTLPASSPTGRDIQNFLYKTVRPVLVNDIKLLDKVAKTFEQQWNEPVEKHTVQSDYGDVLAVRTFIKLYLSIIYLQEAYYLNAVFTSDSIEQFLRNDANFMLIANRSYLDGARSYLRSADNDLNSAIDFIRKEKDNQKNDFINMMGVSVKDIDRVKTLIRELQSSLNGRGVVNFRHQGIYCANFSIHASRKPRCFQLEGPSSLVTQINADPLFDGLNLRALLPRFKDNHATGFFRDPKFGGVVLKVRNQKPSVFFNDDSDHNGVADMFE